jgi:hypothetical protein
MYFGTGEGFFNADGYPRVGHLEIVDGGANWSQLATDTIPVVLLCQTGLPCMPRATCMLPRAAAYSVRRIAALRSHGCWDPRLPAAHAPTISATWK